MFTQQDQPKLITEQKEYQ